MTLWFTRPAPAPLLTLLDVLTEGIHEGGITGDEIVRRLGERGVRCTAAELETHGLSTVAAMTCDEEDE